LISVVIATHDSEALLVPTLSVLVPGALAGLVREVIVADGGSKDDTAKVADIAGCSLIAKPGPLGARLSAAATTARSSWLLFLKPGTVLGAQWMDEVSRFMHEAEINGANSCAAVFRKRARHGRSALAEALSLLVSTLGTLPRPDQGLLIAKRHYDAIGGHRADHADPEIDLLRRLGRRHIETLRSGAGINRD
jgi:glycosyltransferase involved in cell wall biosynthesis